jgi:hypothetical protein
VIIVYQLFANGRWFSPGIPASSTTKTGRHDITEILLKVALNTKNQSINPNCVLNLKFAQNDHIVFAVEWYIPDTEVSMLVV